MLTRSSLNVVDLSVELRAELAVSRTMPPQHSKSQLQSQRAEAAAVGRLRYRVLRRAVLRQSADMGAQKTGGVLVPGEVRAVGWRTRLALAIPGALPAW
jgi:hypothetical protein